MILISSSFIDNCLATDEQYPNIMSLSGSKINSRYISEIEYMMPIRQTSKSINLIDVKLKNDNKKSIEGNIGIIYRYNFFEEIILGFYGYFDRRRTRSNLTANQLTTGIELLNSRIDGRFNLYIPDNKKKTLSPASKTFVRENTRVYVLKKNSVEEVLLPGYDVEIGIPLFTFIPNLNEKYGTKVRVKRFKFSRKGSPQYSGIQYIIEQKIKDNLFDNSGSEITLSVGGIYNNNKKWENFANLGIRWSLPHKHSKIKLNKIEKRMIDKTTRDIDIVTSLSGKNTSEILPVFFEGKEIRNVYFVGETDDDSYYGDGSYENPFSRKQLTNLITEKKFQKKSTDLIIPVILQQNITKLQYYELVNSCSAVDVKKYNNIRLEDEYKSPFFIEHMHPFFPEYEHKSFSNKNDFIAETTTNYAIDEWEEIKSQQESSSTGFVMQSAQEIENTSNALATETENLSQTENQILRLGRTDRNLNLDHITTAIMTEVSLQPENTAIVEPRSMRLHPLLRITPLRIRAQRLNQTLRAEEENNAPQEELGSNSVRRQLNF